MAPTGEEAMATSGLVAASSCVGEDVVCLALDVEAAEVLREDFLRVDGAR